MSKVLHTNVGNFDSDVLKSNVPVFVDFWAEWCGPCRVIGPIVDELAGEFDGKVRFAKVNVDENQEIAEKYDVQAIPTLIVFRNGEPVSRIVGAAPKNKYHALIREVLGN